MKELDRKIQLGIKPFKYEYLDTLITIIEPEAGQEWWMVRVLTQAMCLYSQTIPDPQPCPQDISIYNRQCNQP